MEQLIDDLDAAPEGSRDLDYAIAKELGWRSVGEERYKEWGMVWRDAKIDEWKTLPWWTISLDAALDLVPVDAKGHRMCTLLECYSDGTGNASVIPFVGEQVWSRKVATPALALCIAALKARQAMEEEP